MRKKILIVFSFILFWVNAQSQNCGTIATPDQLRFMQEFQRNSESIQQGRTKVTIIKIPLKLHAVRTSTGGSGGLSAGQISNLFTKLNGYYVNSGIEFFQFGEVNNIDNDTYYDLNSANEGGLAVPNDVPDVINVYFMNTLITGGTPLCGYTRFPPSSDRVFTTYGCSLGGTTLEHELGHYFTLFHTHGTTNTGTTDELVNGSNCQNAGDRLCDTPADPNLTGKVNASCIYTGVDRDANGQLYSPNVRNIMAYSRDACQDFFSGGQYDRIRNGYENGRSYLLVQSDDFTANIYTATRQLCKGGSINFLATGSGATSWSWEFQGGSPAVSTDKSPKVLYNQSGTYTVKLTARASNGQTVIVERNGFITITDPLDNALGGSLSFTFDSMIPSSFEIDNPDQGVTFGFSNYDRSDAASGSVFVNNFNYQSETFINYDKLIGPFLNNSGVSSYQLSFDVSYSSRLGGFDGVNLKPDAFDSLAVTTYSQCGAKPIQLWKQGGNELQTVPMQSTEFFPNPTQWKNISLKVDVGVSEFTQFSWINTSVNGNNLFIDNIRVQPDYSLNSPSNFRASNVLSTGITLRWLDNSNNELNFVIERSENDGPFIELTTVPKNTISFVDVNINPGTKYKYQIYSNGFQDFKSQIVGPIAVDFFVTGLEEPNKKLELYPNPVSDILYISNNEVEECKIQIFSILGVVSPEISVDRESQIEYSFKHLVAGVYIVKATFKNRNRFIKLIKPE
jgi:PKD repeat protein